MPRIRANSVFVVLMLVGVLSAFVLPPGCSSPVQSAFSGLFSPVSAPTRAIAGMIDRRFHSQATVDDGSVEPRASQTVFDENHRLRTALTSLQLKFDNLSRLNADRHSVGDILPMCEPVTVTGTEPSGLREVLQLASTSASFLGRPVVHGTDLVGRISRAGITGSQVQLITDPGSSLTARIGRYVTEPNGQVKAVFVEHLQPLVRGVGHNTMTVSSTISTQQATAEKIAVNDFIVLDDRDWPQNLQGFNIGRITSIRPQPNAPLFAEIRIEPSADLMRLSEVMVMVKD